jgi:hypothetical protein
MLRHVRAALAAAVVVAAFTLAPAAAGERATLRVTARVVDRCTIDVPFQIPPGLWRDRKHQLWRLVRHECRSGPPIRVDARRVLISHLRERLLASAHRDRRPDMRSDVRQDGGRVVEVRHPIRDNVVLITITY